MDEDEFDTLDDNLLNGLMDQVETVESVELIPKATHQKSIHDYFQSKPQVFGRHSTGSYHRLDPEAFKTWIYPTNYPERSYQFSIVQSALFSNTLVALPTGLGKTFIAAVIMYNYLRWFPEGKVVFMAPTKPLVAQQVDACYKIVGIPKVISLI